MARIERAEKSGFALEAQQKVHSKYDAQLGHQLLEWVKGIVGEDLNTDGDSNNLISLFKDGSLLCRFANCLEPGVIKKINSSTLAFKQMENVSFFLSFAQKHISPSELFQTVDLYESQDPNAVLVCLSALARKSEKLFGKPGMGPKESVSEKREWTEEQLRAGQGVIGLQMGSNKGASASGLNMGNTRHIMSEIMDSDDSDTESVALDDLMIDEDSGLLSDCMQDFETTDYKILPLPDVISQIKTMSEEIAEVIDLPPSAIRLLLPVFQFNKEKLINQFTSDGHVQIFLANTEVDFDLTDAINFYAYEGECSICFCDNATLISLKCGHHCCSDCWNFYIKTEVHEKGNVNIACFHNECNIKLMDEQVHRMIINDPLREEYDRLLAKIFIDKSPSIKWCSGRGCDKVVKLYTSQPLSIYCDCGADFCSACNESSHLPLSCDRLKTWKDGKMLESASIEWISKNSRPCPKCKARIEKNGGCNFMECSSCQAPFCWHCMKVLARTHDPNHNCTRYLEDTSLETEEQIDLHRFEHYKQRFTTHMESEKLELALRANMENFCDKLDEKGFPKYTTGICLRALQELLKSRRLLAYSCAFSYYMKHEQSRNIFDDNVELLEGYTERLSSQFVGTSPFWKCSDNPLAFQPYLADLQDKMKHIKKCRQILLEHANECQLDKHC